MSTPPTGVLFYEPRAKPLSTIGLIQPGSYYQFYNTGTLTLTNVYADGGLTTPLSQTPGSGGTTAASDGRLVPIYLSPATTYRVQLYSALGILLEDTDPYIPVSVPTQAQIGQSLYPQTAAEIAASVTPTNYAYAPGIIDRYATNTTPGTTDMSAALVAASKCNSYVRGVQGSTYNFASNPILSPTPGTSFTLDLTGCTIVTTASPLNTVGLIKFTPASLVASGRLAGSDYPSNWLNGSTPEPTDADPNAMMHESVAANRLTNITVIGLTTSATMTGLWVHSCDGLTLRNCNMACSGWSNVRIAHCTDISIDSSNTFGGSGTYLVFLLKCGLGIRIDARFSSQNLPAVVGRLLSCKGAFHGIGQSIFGNSISATDMGARISGSFVSNADCHAFDSAAPGDCNPNGSGVSGSIATFGSITGGSGYTTPGLYYASLTGGTGTGATAQITVSGGAVTQVVLFVEGSGYGAGNTLSATDASLGGRSGGSAFSIPVATTAGGTGIQRQPWYGTGTNYQVVGGNFLTTYTPTVGNENKGGRAFFTSDPHFGVTFERNTCNNATVAVSGTLSARVCNNHFVNTNSGYTIVVNPTGNNPGVTTQYYVISGNQDYGWVQVSGSSVAAIMQIAGLYGKIENNAVLNPGTGLTWMVADNSADYLECGYNTIFYNAASPTSVASGLGTHGQQYNNKLVNNNTGVVAYSEFQGSTTGAIPDGGTVAHFLFGTPSTVVAQASASGTIVGVTAVSSTNFTVSLKTVSGGAIVPAANQAVYFRAKL